MGILSSVSAAVGAGAVVGGTAVSARLFGVSDILWQAIIAGTVTIVIAYFQMKTMSVVKEGTGKAEAAAEEAKAEAQEVAATLKEKNVVSDAALTRITEISKDTHTLVNNNMAIQLRLNLALSKRLFGSTGKKEDKEAVNLAETLYNEHMAKQKKVDEAVSKRKEQS